MSLYNEYGQINLTPVSGSSITGLYAADGSWNIVFNNGSSITGFYHPCGAINAVAGPGLGGEYAPNGSMYVVASSSGGYTPSNPNGGSTPINPVGQTFLTTTDASGNEINLTAADSNSVEQPLTLAV